MLSRQIDVDGASYCLLDRTGFHEVITYDIVGPTGERMHVTVPFAYSDDDGIANAIRAYRAGRPTPPRVLP